LLCVEILSPDDSMISMQERIKDYVAFGTENVWIFDPRCKKAYWADVEGVYEAINGVFEARGGAYSHRLELALAWVKGADAAQTTIVSRRLLEASLTSKGRIPSQEARLPQWKYRCRHRPTHLLSSSIWTACWFIQCRCTRWPGSAI